MLTPTAGDDKPTAKALKEHLPKYRKGIKSGISFSMNGKRPADDSSATPTPKKRRATKKVKEGEVSDDGPTTPTPKKNRQTKKKVKEEEEVSDDSGVEAHISSAVKDRD